MDQNRWKKASQWYFDKVYGEEAIRPRPEVPAEKLPPLILEARALERKSGWVWQAREMVFVKQARLLADYEDDYEFSDPVVRYFPTYQALTDRELRGYFSWRTKLRRGQVEKTNLSFAFLYIYELLNQIGVEDPADGYQKLADFRERYGPLENTVLPYLNRWMLEYVIYYDLEPELLAGSPQLAMDRAINVLDTVHDHSPQQVMAAVEQLAPKWLGRSRFFAAHREDRDAVVVRVLGRVWDHCAARCKKSMVEQYFGPLRQYQVRLFETAVFFQQHWPDREYRLDERCVYRCRAGLWTVERHSGTLGPNTRLEELMKTIDAVMRQEYGDRHPIKSPLDAKWLLKIIRQETQALLAEKKAAEERKITIDFKKLDRIRRDADVTRDKLTVEEELEEEIPAPAPEPPQNDTPLSDAEYRLLQCLLYGRELGWVQAEGHILSVLLDSINDKLYENFLDTVVDDAGPVEDYIDELKEMVRP